MVVRVSLHCYFQRSRTAISASSHRRPRTSIISYRGRSRRDSKSAAARRAGSSSPTTVSMHCIAVFSASRQRPSNAPPAVADFLDPATCFGTPASRRPTTVTTSRTGSIPTWIGRRGPNQTSRRSTCVTSVTNSSAAIAT